MSRLTEQILNRVIVRRQEEEDGEFSQTEHLGSTVNATHLSNLASDNPLDLGVTDGTRFVHSRVDVQDDAREPESRTFKTSQQPPIARGDGILDAKVIYDSWVDYPGAFNEETIVLHPVLNGSFVQPQPGLTVSVQVTWDSAADFKTGEMWWFTDGVKSSWYQIISSALIGDSLIALTLLNPNIDQTLSTLNSQDYEAIPGNAAMGSIMDTNGIFVRRKWYRSHDDGGITTAVLVDFEQPEIGEVVEIPVEDATLFSGTTGQYAYFFDGVNQGWYTILAEGSTIAAINTGLGGSAEPGTTMKGTFGRITPRPGINWTGSATFSATFSPSLTVYDYPSVTNWNGGSYTNRFLFRSGRHLSINHDVTSTTATSLTTVQNEGYPYNVAGYVNYRSVAASVSYKNYQGDFDFRTIWWFPDTFNSFSYLRGFTYGTWAGIGAPTLTGWTSDSGDASEITAIFLYDGTSKKPAPAPPNPFYAALQGNSRFCRQLSAYPGTTFRMFMRNNESIALNDYTYGWYAWTYYFLMEFVSATRFSYLLPEDPEEEVYYWQIVVRPIKWNLPSGSNDLTGFGLSSDGRGAFLEYRGGANSAPPVNQGNVIQSFTQKIELPDTGYVRILGTGQSLTASSTVSVLGGPTLSLNVNNNGSNRSSWVYVSNRETFLTVSVKNSDTLGTNPVGGCGFKLEYIPDTYLTIED